MMGNPLQKALRVSDEGNANLLRASAWMCAFRLAAFLPVILLAMIANEMVVRSAGANAQDVPLLPYLVAAAALVVVMFLAYWVSYKSKYLSAGDEDARMRIALAERIRRLPMSYLGKRDLSDFTSAVMDDVDTVQGVLATSFVELVSGLLFALASIVCLFVVDWRMTLALAACLPLAALFMALSRLISEGQNKRNRAGRLQMSEAMQEYLENMQELHALNLMNGYQGKIRRASRKLVPGLVLYELLAGLGISFGENFLRCGMGVVIVYGAARMASGDLGTFEFLLFLFASVRLYEPLCVAIERLGAIIHALVASQRIGEILDHPVQEGDGDVHPRAYDLEFDHVTFAYGEDDVIHDVSFTAPQGQTTALVGPSGCGKSTLCRLAARFWDVDRGTVRMGGIDIGGIDPETLLRSYAFVFQDVVLFDDTIANNIRIGRAGATDEEVREVARAACCDEFVEKLPHGYETIVGENGRTLSGGQRQRISIARALLKDAPIVLLDEATASVDPENETHIQQALGALVKNKTVLVVAHRLRSVAGCDHIVVLQEGTVVEEGVHEQLMGAKGLYSRLFALQTKSTSWSAGRDGNGVR